MSPWWKSVRTLGGFIEVNGACWAYIVDFVIEDYPAAFR